MRDLLRSLEKRERIWIPCPIRTIFGIRCPGCGMTHALVALLRGDVRRAIQFNPFVLALVPLIALALFDVARHLIVKIAEYRADRTAARKWK